MASSIRTLQVDWKSSVTGVFVVTTVLMSCAPACSRQLDDPLVPKTMVAGTTVTVVTAVTVGVPLVELTSTGADAAVGEETRLGAPTVLPGAAAVSAAAAAANKAAFWVLPPGDSVWSYTAVVADPLITTPSTRVAVAVRFGNDTSVVVA
jgi:hypothetical protein